MDATLYQRIVLAGLAAGLLWALYRILEPFWSALAWGVCLAFLLAPLQAWLTRKLRNRPSAAAGLITAATPIVVLAPLTLLALSFVDQVSALINRLRASATLLQTDPFAQAERWPVIGPALRWIRDNTPVSTQQLQEWITAAAENALRSAAGFGGNLLASALGTVTGFFLMLFLLFFLLRDGAALLERMTNLVPLESARRDSLLRLIGSTTRAVVFGTVATALLQGALVAIGFAIAGLPSPIVFGVIAALLALLPVGGAAIVWLPAAIWLAATQQWGWAVFMLVWGAAVSSSDNFLRPMLISSHAPVSTLAVFIGVIGGASAFGAVGLIIGPVLLALIGTVASQLISESAQHGATQPVAQLGEPQLPVQDPGTKAMSPGDRAPL
jgi:predicted PurR-regulated permease PerM